MWTEQNVLKIDVDVVVSDVEQCTVKSHGCPPYNMKRRKAFVLDNDMEMPSVVLSNLLSR